MKQNLRNGILFALLFAIPAHFLGQTFPIIGGPVFGILLGMLAGSIKRPVSCESGIKFTGKKILQYSIILLGFEMNLYNVLTIGTASLSVMLITLTTAFATAIIFGRLLRLDFNTTLLIGGGTAICGGSAIAAIAPVIGAKDRQIAFSISTIFLFNVIAVFIFPPLGHYFSFSDTGFGMWAGTAINDTSSVVAAGYSYSPQAGAYATIVKLTRALMIVPVCLLIALFMSRHQTAQTNASFRITDIFPYFILWFIAACIINTFIMHDQLAPMYKLLSDTGKFCIVLAMTAIGLNTNLKQLLQNGFRPILLGLICWFAVAIMSLAVQFYIGFI